MTNEEILAKWIKENEHYRCVAWYEENNGLTGYGFLTTKKTITLKECQALVAKLKEKEPEKEFAKICITMTGYDFSDITPDHVPYIMHSDFGLKYDGPKKEAVYEVRTNTLTIFQEDEPVYENADGNICRDSVALADCMGDGPGW